MLLEMCIEVSHDFHGKDTLFFICVTESTFSTKMKKKGDKHLNTTKKQAIVYTYTYLTMENAKIKGTKEVITS